MVMSNHHFGTELQGNLHACGGTTNKSAHQIAPMLLLTHNHCSLPPENWKGYMQHANGEQEKYPAHQHNRTTTTRETTWAWKASRLAPFQPPISPSKTLRV
eukprot:15334170-Ditylum_brightwellii.AAC.1